MSHRTPLDQSDLPDEWRSAFEWIERELGGHITHAERQARWRPAWLIDLEHSDSGETLPLYFRGERGETDHGIYALEHEMRVLQVLAAHDIPVPRVYGFCPAPRGIVMERCPGRANLATAKSRAEREAVLDDYMDILARIHKIDVAAFEAVGLEPPETPEEVALGDLDAFERAYRRRKRRPEPAIEFLLGWVRRNVPRGRRRVSLICSDSGQFLFEKGRVTAVLDLELARLGDPVADLGGLPGRDLSEPLGDLTRAVRFYESSIGQKIDRSLISFHTVRFNLITPLAVAHLVAEPMPDVDMVQYLTWYQVWSRSSLEIVARRLAVPVDGPPSAEGAGSPDLTASEGDFAAYERAVAERRALYLDRHRQLSPQLDGDYLDDVAPLLGRRPATRADADAELEGVIAGAGPESDTELVALLHRRALRDESILYPVMGELAGARMQQIR